MRTAMLLVTAILLGSMPQRPARAANAGPATRPVKMELLKPRVPKPFLDGRWLQYNQMRRQKPDAEDLVEGPWPEFRVPKGSVNLALKKPVTASEGSPIIGELSQITDGDDAGAKSSVVEIGPGLQWVQVDLEVSCAVYAILVWHDCGGPNLARDVIVHVSDDPQFKRGVFNVFNNDQDGSAGLGKGKDREYIEAHFTKIMDARGVRGRYVRVYGGGDFWHDSNRFIEIEAWGLPADKAPATLPTTRESP